MEGVAARRFLRPDAVETAVQNMATAGHGTRFRGLILGRRLQGSSGDGAVKRGPNGREAQDPPSPADRLAERPRHLHPRCGVCRAIGCSEGH